MLIGPLAELGVLMLLFFIGMELSLRSFRRIWRIAVGVATLQIIVSLVVMLLFRWALDWPLEHAILFAFVLALSSTAVAIRMLEDTGELRSRVGMIAVGILIAQDLAVAPMLLVLESLSKDVTVFNVIVKVVITVALLVFAVLYFSRRQAIDLPLGKIAEDKRELVPLAALTGCFRCCRPPAGSASRTPETSLARVPSARWGRAACPSASPISVAAGRP